MNNDTKAADIDPKTFRKLMRDADKLQRDVRELYEKTKSEDLGQADSELQTVLHALEGVLENKASRKIRSASDVKAHSFVTGYVTVAAGATTRAAGRGQPATESSSSALQRKDDAILTSIWIG